MKHVIDKNGKVFISVDAMLGMLQQLIESRDKMVADDPGHKIFVPGSDAAVGILGNMLVQIRKDYFENTDLTDEASELLEGLYGFLDEQ